MSRFIRAICGLLAVMTVASAKASCTAGAQYNFLFANQPAGSLAYGSSYSYSAANGTGDTRPFTMALAQNGLTGVTINTTQLPAVSTLVTGPDATQRDLVLGGIFSGRTPDIGGNTRVITATFTFAQPIRDFAIRLHDVDFTTNQYRDLVMITGAAGAATYTPVMSSPWGNSNAVAAARTNASSSVTFGPGGTPLTMSAAQAAGSGASGNNSDTGTIVATFVQPVTSVTLRYGNASLSAGENATGQQGLGIAGISFCPMPSLSISKTSAPAAGALGAYNLPSSDIVYTLTVTNSGASPVDAGTIVLTDLLPPDVTFRNTVLDGATSLPFALTSGTSGVSLTAASASYSNDGGASWSYSPAAGYDPAINGVRITPSGTLAANSNFAVSLVVRLK